MSEERRIRVAALTRVEGEGGLYVRLKGGDVAEVKLTIYEPPRLFEAFLRGRPLQDVPDITARICGICPVAYQMSSTHALEAALGLSVTPEIRTLRRLLYCGEWIESHCLHIHLLHAPDFFGVESGMALAQWFPDEVARGLRLKKLGNELLEVLGGRAIHPINVAVGGFYRVPRRDALLRLLPEFEQGLQGAVEMTRWVASFDFPDYTRPYHLVALQHPDEYPMNEGAVASTDGLCIPVSDYERHFEEFQVEHSTALHSGRGPQHAAYHVGPLARVSLNRERLSPTAQRLADEIGFEHPCRNPFRSIVARALEVVHAFEEAIAILRAFRPFSPPRVEFQPCDGEGCAATEAPRGLLYHRYGIDRQGLVTFARIVPPTSQNQHQIEEDLYDWLPRVMQADERATALQCERLVRCYDPCISCSTHFLRLTVDREP